MTNDILSLAGEEQENENSLWSIDQIKVVYAEFSIMNQNISEGYLYFEFGKKNSMLRSTYILSDSLQNLNGTKLGKMIHEFQVEYDRFKVPRFVQVLTK